MQSRLSRASAGEMLSAWRMSARKDNTFLPLPFTASCPMEVNSASTSSSMALSTEDRQPHTVLSMSDSHGVESAEEEGWSDRALSRGEERWWRGRIEGGNSTDRRRWLWGRDEGVSDEGGGGGGGSDGANEISPMSTTTTEERDSASTLLLFLCPTTRVDAPSPLSSLSSLLMGASPSPSPSTSISQHSAASSVPSLSLALPLLRSDDRRRCGRGEEMGGLVVEKSFD